MKLFLTIEAQNATENGLADIFFQVDKQLSFITDKKADLEDINNYGTEFRMVSIIPTCVDDLFWNALGWKERVKIWRKTKEADVRLRMDYNRFIKESPENRRLLFVKVIIESIQLLQEQARGDFQGDRLISDMLNTLNVRQSQLDNL